MILCTGPVCVECGKCDTCGREVTGGRHIDNCACIEPVRHHTCEACK